ncbi:MAG: polysaccharide biosynthesis C-terminal domain-containing protein, partial [Oscillospiraceae bacterium]|nr:polysaccharide biosynthesis C-terminal domain-containing protein [Oscillospiraceae bacterium]
MQTPVLYILYKMAPMLPIGTNRLFTLRAARLLCVQGIRSFTPTGSSISPDNSDLSIVFSQNFYIFPVFSVHWGLSGFQADAVTAFGLFAGGAVTVINLPVSVCYGLAAASIPRVAMATKGGKSVRRRILFSLGITALIGGVSALGLYLFAEPAATIIFRSLQGEELSLLIRLIQAFAVSAFTLSCVQTLSACLTAQGKPQYSALAMLVGVTVKTGVYAVLMQKPSVGVFGLAHATNIGYTVAFLLD